MDARGLLVKKLLACSVVPPTHTALSLSLCEMDWERKCERCENQTNYCLCDHLPHSLIELSTRVVVLQDIHELCPSKMEVSSVPLLGKILSNYQQYCSTSTDWIEKEIIDDLCVVLYPSESSIPLDDYLKSHPPPAKLFVLDGSWVSVQHLLYHTHVLQPRRVCHVRLTPFQLHNRISIYHSLGLRSEPAANFVSTAESIALALLNIHPKNEATRYILEAFQSFVEKRVVNIVPRSQSLQMCQSEELLSDRGCKEKKVMSKPQLRVRKRLKEQKKKRRNGR